MSTITLTEDYGYTQYKISGLPVGTIIDAEAATWIQDNDDSDGDSNPYPVSIKDSPGVILDGGTIEGNIDMISAWRTVYDLGNSAGIRTEDSPNVIIRDWRITDTWDGIRVSWNSPDFLIEDVWVTNVRDDAIENDKLNSGTIRDSLFDGVFKFLSLDPSSSSPVDGHNETVTIDGVLVRLQPYLYKGEMTHGSLIKTDSATDGAVTPNLRFFNNVFAIEEVDHNSYRSMFDAWDHTIESSGNFFLNLSDTPLPDDYPIPPAGWTILEGQEARDYWEQARDAWIVSHTDGGEPPVADEEPPVVDEEPPVVDEEPPVVDEEPPVVDDDVATFDGVSFKGSKHDDVIVGNALDNNIDGDNGDDTIKGGDGNDIIRGDDGVDVLWGGDGDDEFFFKRLSDSRENRGIDTIMDFTEGDKIDLSRIDANRKAGGDQAFVLITGEFTEPGQLSISFDADSGYTVVTGNIDRDSKAELTILLEGDIALVDSDFVL